MKRFFNSPRVVATVWFVVIAAIAGSVGFALLQPAPQPGAEPVVVALAAPQPPQQEAAQQEAAQQEAPQEEEGEEAPATAVPEQPDDGEALESEAVQVALPPAEPAPEAADPEPAAPETAAPESTPAQPAPAEATESGAAEPPAAAPETPAAEAEAPVQQALIPVIPPAPEQLAPWQRYSQPFNLEDQRPRIAVVLSGLGLSDSATEAAIEQLPAAVTLSFSPYARGLERWIALARARGHEVMLDLPMEPVSFPNEDPGPQALLTSLAPETNLDRLDWVLSRGSAYVGLAGSMGSRFTATRESVEPVLQEVKARGLLFLDRRTTEESLVPTLAEEIGLPYAVNSRTVDERQASRVAIDARLAQVERIALTDGAAIAMAQPYPVSIERLAEWAADLPARGFAVAPISALVERPEAP